MRRIAFVAVVGSVAGLVLFASSGQASLYSPQAPYAIPVGEDGKAIPLDKKEMKRRIGVLKNLLNPEFKTDDRDAALARIESLKKLLSPTPEDTAALAVELLRIGKASDAAGLLTAGDRRGFLSNITLAHIHAATGDWASATDYLDIANSAPQPTAWPGLTPAQLAWQLKINRDPLVNLFHNRWRESRHRIDPDNENIDPVFPIQFVNAKGEYEPGVLAPDERAKLPPDAVAIAQQLVLWFPTDIRLLWLLAETYAATGDFKLSQELFDYCVSDLGRYGNRKVLQAHRAAVTKAAEAMPKTVSPEDVPIMAPTPAQPSPPSTPHPDATPISMTTIGIYFGAVGVVALFALARALSRRGKGGSGCRPCGMG